MDSSKCKQKWEDLRDVDAATEDRRREFLQPCPEAADFIRESLRKNNPEREFAFRMARSGWRTERSFCPSL